MRCRSILSTRVRATAILFFLITASAASAQDVPFAFLIGNGWKSFYAGAALRAEQDLVSWYGRGQIYAIVNGHKGAELGTAHIEAFARTVPDPTFNSLGGLAGFIDMNFTTFRGHLTVFETPSGLKTTIAILDQNGKPDTAISGVWVFGDGAAVVGGTSNDMVVGGIVHFGSPLPASTMSLSMSPYFPIVPFSNDLPFHVFWSSSLLNWQVGTGSSYHNSANGPVRTYMRSDLGGFSDDFTGALTVLHTSGDNYVVLSCGWYEGMTALGPQQIPVQGCALSGVGSLASRVTGRAASYSLLTLQEYVMQLQIFIAP